MAENSTIEWTDHTFNGWIGCTKVGPGCDHCYAEALATSRLKVAWGPGAARRRTAASTWKQPYRWNNRAPLSGRRERVFCSSLADVFDNEVPPEWRKDLFWLIRETPNLDWLLLTKRIGNAPNMIAAAGGLPENVRVGATIVNQEEWVRDSPKIAQIMALVGKHRIFLSMEPLLGPVDLIGGLGHVRFDRVVGWVIVGGESGAGARPMHPDWVRSLRDQCAAAGVPFLFKQWGEWAPVATETEEQRDRWLAFDDQGKTIIAWPDGAFGTGTALLRGGPGAHIVRVGKKHAGRLLDGVQHDGVPA